MQSVWLLKAGASSARLRRMCGWCGKEVVSNVCGCCRQKAIV